MTATPTVSVLLTTYNRERYVGAAIESVLAQRFTDFELIVTDNQSADRTVAIAREYAAQDSRIRVEVNERNLGQFGNRNRAASLARGRYLKYHDSDDVMYPHCLQVMVELLDSEPAAGFGLSTGWAWPGGPAPMLLTPRQCYQREFLGLGLFMCGPSCALFRRELFLALGGFPERGVASDYLFWLRACTRTSVLLFPADLFWYRIHAGQELASPGALREYAGVAADTWDALAADECPLTPEEREAARRRHAWNTARHIRRDLGAGRFALAWYRLRHAGLGPRDWLRYLRRPTRSALAGTPLDPAGEFVIPAWVRRRR